MAIWALSDLHLSFGVANKTMDIFGEQWRNHPQKIERAWTEAVSPEDLVLIPGDLSWAMTVEEVKPDLLWLDALPGEKVLVKGNHDYWWGSVSKVKAVLPPSVHIIHNDAMEWKGVAIGGARLWECDEFAFDDLFSQEMLEECVGIDQNEEQRKKVFRREVHRLELSLRAMQQDASLRIAMAHFPPIGTALQDSTVSLLLERYHVDICVFGHLHGIAGKQELFGEKNSVRYCFSSCDYLNFAPALLVP